MMFSSLHSGHGTHAAFVLIRQAQSQYFRHPTQVYDVMGYLAVRKGSDAKVQEA
jgi:hypothetical protein